MTTLLAIVLFIILLSSNRSLSGRLSVIEAKLKNGAGFGENKTETPVVNQGGVAGQDVLVSKFAPNFAQSFTAEVEEQNKFTTWLKEDWLMKLGAFLFILGFGWFVSYAFANNWIGPIGRISAGIIAGALVMILGYWRMLKYPSQGAVFMSLGAGMAMLTIFAGRSIYGFFTPESAVAMDFIIVAFVSFASYKFNIQALASLAQILAFATPLLTAGQTDSFFLFSYLFFISLATLFLASITGWRQLITSSLIFVGMYSFPYITASGGMYHRDAPIILNFAYLFSVLYLVSGMVAVLKKGVLENKNEIFLAILNGFFLFSWVYNVAPAEWSSMIFAVWAIIFAISSFMVFKSSSALAPFYAYGSVAIGFIVAATALELEGTTLVIAFTIEILLLIASVISLTKDIKAINTTAWLFIAPILLSFTSVTNYSNSKVVLSDDFFALLVLGMSLILAGRLITYFVTQNKSEEEAGPGAALVVFGIIYLGYIIWQCVHIFMSDAPDMATLASLLIFTVVGLVAYFSGLYGNDMARRTYGIALLAFVVVRLLIVDVWNMELFGKVVTFLAIGILLMSTAFVTKNKKHEN
jgi:uncharacterized membrane protein